MKRFLLLLSSIVVLACAVWVFGSLPGRLASAARDLETYPLERKELLVTTSATGMVRSRQSAVIAWKTSGTVGRVTVEAGQRVSQGDLLAELDPESLPPAVILAQVEKAEAERALEDLVSSRRKAAEAAKAVEAARQALDEAYNTESRLADARQAVAEANAAVEQAQRNLDILTRPPSQEAVDTAYARMISKEKKRDDLQQQVERIYRRLAQPESNLAFFESKGDYRKLLPGLELQLAQAQIEYEEYKARYEWLNRPRDPLQVAAAEAELSLAQAQLLEAQRVYERIEAGPDGAELAVLEAQLADAERELERWKDGPDEGEIEALEARIAAAEAMIAAAQIRAPFDGVVTQVFNQAGDQAAPGVQAFRLDDLDRLVVDIQVSEVDIASIEVGQQVFLSFEGISPLVFRSLGRDPSNPGTQGTAFTGRVLQVARVGDQVGGLTHFPVTVEVLNGEGLVRPGMIAEAEIIIRQLQDVLAVPNRAIRYENGERVVYVLEDQRPVPVQVTLGAATAEYSQVLDGELKAGDLIVLDPPDNIDRGVERPGGS